MKKFRVTAIGVDWFFDTSEDAERNAAEHATTRPQSVYSVWELKAEYSAPAPIQLPAQRTTPE